MKRSGASRTKPLQEESKSILSELKPAHKIHKDTCKIDWNQPIDKIHNHIRGLSPYPASWSTMVNEGEHIFIKIYNASKETESHTFENGKVFFDKKEMKVAVDGGYIKLLGNSTTRQTQNENELMYSTV